MGATAAEKVVVAVKAAKDIPRAALVWALTHVVQPGDRLTLLVVVPSYNSGRKLWRFPLFAGDCASKQRSHSGTSMEQKADITDLCSQMMLQLHDVYNPNKINVKIKIAAGSPCGSVAAEAKKIQASWVVLDKQLKNEEKHCLDELHCNIVGMKRSQLKVLRLNLVGVPAPEALPATTLPSELNDSSRKIASGSSNLAPSVTPISSPETEVPFSNTEVGTSSASTSSDPGTSPHYVSETNEGLEIDTVEERNLNVTSSDSDNESLASSVIEFEPLVSEVLSMGYRFSKQVQELSQRFIHRNYISKTSLLGQKFSKLDYEADIKALKSESNFRANFREAGSTSLNARQMELDFGESLRGTISISRNSPAGPPPLCSICQHTAPLFGKPPRWFSYTELELATDGFSQANFLAEGGFGSVHRGILRDGQAVAVKQHKLASSQGDHEFCSEVEVLSCAQHCNVVMLIGYCAEDNRRLLVYEYICNSSLHAHLYGHNNEPLEWSARQKIAVGAARGLRYLHEDCRVGCIVHRDMRPHNILLTHDFKPLVGDFGLARCQPDGGLGEETRVIGTIGYMAPEYSQTGKITEKADVYSFGVVLVELITGRKAMDISRPKGQQLLTEWARPLLEEYTILELIDPRLGKRYSRDEALRMMRAALLCIRRDPRDRPRMSQILRILEGNMGMELNYFSALMRSGQQQHESEEAGEKHSNDILAATRG